jgi:large-conductance mechanosensitive channel
MNFFNVLFGNLLTATIGFAAIAIMIAIAVRAIKNITRQQDEEKREDPPKDL